MSTSCFARRRAGILLLLFLAVGWSGCDVFGSSSGLDASILIEDPQRSYYSGDTIRYTLVNESRERPVYVRSCGPFLENRYDGEWQIVAGDGPCFLVARPPIEPGASEEGAWIVPDTVSAGEVRIAANVGYEETGDEQKIHSRPVDVASRPSR